MNLRLAILSLTSRYALSAEAGAEIKRLAKLDAEPSSLPQQLSLGMAALGAALGGLGIVFWIAANWESMSRTGRFALLQATLACMLLGAWRRPSARMPLALAGFLSCGALFAYFGQTYQTGADPWQLFALWAALTLPLCLGVRHDALWIAWAIVALTAALLWSQTPTGTWWQRSPYRSSLGSWVPAIALAFAFRCAPAHRPGAGVWPMRLCMIHATIGLATTAVWSLFSSGSHGLYPITLIIVAALAYAFSRRKLFDIFVISAIGLSANVLLVSGLARALFHEDTRGAEIPLMLLIGCAAAGLLAATVKLILHLSRRQA
jgi:uncharacterized membrane protein